MYSSVLVGVIEEAAVVGDRDALDTRQGRELAGELALQGAEVLVGREGAAEVDSDCVPAAGVVLYKNALLVAAVHVAGDGAQLIADYSEIAYPGYLVPQPSTLG